MTTYDDSLLMTWQAGFGGWEGSIQDLCELAARLQADLLPGPIDEAEEPLPNVRLLRHYLAIGLLTRGERRGREGVFGLRQLLEYLAARALLRDGWPLAKIAAFASRASDAELARLLPAPPAGPAGGRGAGRTRAQDLVSQFRAKAAAPTDYTVRPAARIRPSEAAEPLFSRKSDEDESASSAQDPVAARLATDTRDRVAMQTRMTTSAEPGGSVRARRTLTFEPAPGCQVTVDERALSQLDEKGLQLLVERLRRALREARRNQGEQDANT
jgi:DNA-binding transcriptional MerR regulator